MADVNVFDKATRSSVIVLIHILALLRAVWGSASDDCPYDASQRAMKCLANIDVNGRRSATLWDYELTRRACRDGTFTSALNCAAKVMKMCQNHRERYSYLSDYLDVDSMRRGIVEFCNNDLKVLKDYSECIKRQGSLVKSCASRELTKYQGKVSNMGGNREERIRATCTFMDETFSCQVNAVRSDCGNTPADILDKLMTHFRLPSCRRRQQSPTTNSAQSLPVRVYTWPFSAAISVLILYQLALVQT